ncbi:MAG: hypothetical protein NTW32_21885 [Chloroflexi bacterium]|nr:hypothetical protein [Chloroflexota bacterium]
MLTHLETSGPDFSAALCVQKNSSGWKEVLEAGIAKGRISL